MDSRSGPVAGRRTSPSQIASTSSRRRMRSGAQRKGSSASLPSTVIGPSPATAAMCSGGGGWGWTRSSAMMQTARRSAAEASRSWRSASVTAATTSRLVPQAISHGVGTDSHAPAAMPPAQASASGTSGAAATPILFAHGDQVAQGGKLLRAEAEDMAQPLGGVKTAAALALLEDAPGQRRTYPRQPGDLVHAGLVEIERARIRSGLLRGLTRGLGGPRRRSRSARARLARSRGRGRERRDRLLAVEGLQPLGLLWKAGAPLAHRQAQQEHGGQGQEQPELRAGGEHHAHPAIATRARLECQIRYARV